MRAAYDLIRISRRCCGTASTHYRSPHIIGDASVFNRQHRISFAPAATLAHTFDCYLFLHADSQVTFINAKMASMNYQIVYDATWLCGQCEGLPHGSDLLVVDQPGRVVGDLAYEVVLTEGNVPQGAMTDPKNLRCPYCGADDLALPTSVKPT